jgi:hypothetical protein
MMLLERSSLSTVERAGRVVRAQEHAPFCNNSGVHETAEPSHRIGVKERVHVHNESTHKRCPTLFAVLKRSKITYIIIMMMYDDVLYFLWHHAA